MIIYGTSKKKPEAVEDGSVRSLGSLSCCACRYFYYCDNEYGIRRADVFWWKQRQPSYAAERTCMPSPRSTSGLLSNSYRGDLPLSFSLMIISTAISATPLQNISDFVGQNYIVKPIPCMTVEHVKAFELITYSAKGLARGLQPANIDKS
jgi:hypothetical protein